MLALARTESDKSAKQLEFQVSVSVLSHALLLFASLFAAAPSETGVAQCPSAAEQTAQLQPSAHIEHMWTPTTPFQQNVRVYAAFLGRDVAPLRVLGRCALKAAPEHQQPVLFGPLSAQLDDRDDQNLGADKAESGVLFAFPTTDGAGPTEMYVLSAPRTQLERPPRV